MIAAFAFSRDGRSGCMRRRRFLNESMDQSNANGSSGPNQADAPRQSGVRNGQLGERQALGPWRRPVRHQRHTQSSIDQGRYRFESGELEPLAWPNADSAEILINQPPGPVIAVVSNERL